MRLSEVTQIGAVLSVASLCSSGNDWFTVFFPNVKSRLQWILASLMAQWVEYLPAMQANTCTTGDLGSVPGSGRSPGEGNGNPRAEEPGRLQSMGLQESDATERLNHQWIQPVLPGITAPFLDLLEGDLATFLAL